MEHRTQSDLQNALMTSTVKAFKTPEGWLFGAGTTVPADATAGWAPGAIFIHSDGSTPGTLNYVNQGTEASSNFDPASPVMAVSEMIGPTATITEYNIFTAPFALEVTGIYVTPSVLQGGALTATVVKATGTATPVKTTTPMHTADAIDLNAGAHTVQTITLTATTADLRLVAGERIAIDLSGALTTGNAVFTVAYRAI